MALILCAVVVALGGCTHAPPEPITIRLVAFNAVDVNGVRYTYRELQDLLRVRSSQRGMAIIRLVAEPQTTYASIKPVCDAATSCGYWKFLLNVGENSKDEEFYGTCSDNPANIIIEVDLLNGRVTRDGLRVEAPLTDILSSETNKQLRVFVHADRTTTSSALYQVLRKCNVYKSSMTIIIYREGGIANNGVQDTLTSSRS